MKYFKNDTASFHCDEIVLASVVNVLTLTREYPFLLRPFRGMNEKARKTFDSAGFILYPTVKKTTLVYENLSDSFFKVVHPLTVKSKIFSLFADRARSVYRLSLDLLGHGIKVPRVTAYGTFRKGKKSFFVMERIVGRSLNDILIKEKGDLPQDIYRKVIEEVAQLHNIGYWFGDAHLAHIFVDDKGLSGFIDIDSMRKNRPFRLKNPAKDLAGLNHPGLPLSKNKKKELLHFYMDKLNIKNREKFLQMIKHYTKRRWN